MGNQPVSRFTERQQWATLSAKSFKEVIQNRSSGQVVERYMLDHIDTQEMKREGPIYEWRINKKAIKFTVEIYEMKYGQDDDETNCSFKLCHRPQQENHRLIMFTEQIHKLYQNNIKFHFNQKEQIKLFAQFCHSIQQLSQKFGYFMISKEMVGYNSKMVGKVWINENFASNHVQYKRQIHMKNDRQKWQSSIIQNLIDICRLCTTQLNSKSNKFQYLISQIRDNRLFSFDLLLTYSRNINDVEFEQEGMSKLKKRFSSQQKSYKVLSNEFSSQIGNSNVKQSIKEVISSTKDYKDTKLIKQKRFLMVPAVNIKKIYQVSEQQRQFLESQMIKSDNYGPQFRRISPFASPSRQNYVQVERHTQSYIKPSDEIYRIKSQINKPLDSILEYPQNSAQKNNDRSGDMAPISSLNSSRQQILLVDSMIVVQDNVQNEQLVRNNTKIILEESLIIRGQQNE